MLSTSSTSSTRRPSSHASTRGSSHSRRESGVVIEAIGTDSRSSYQSLREYPAAAQRGCPSARASAGATACPSVGSPTTISAPNGAARSASQPTSRSCTANEVWLAISPATAVSPRSRSGSHSAEPSGMRAG